MAKHTSGLRCSSLILALAMLCGCTSDFDPSKQDKEAAEQAAKAFGAVDDAKCQGGGLQQGSAAYAQCRKYYENLHKQMGIE